MSDFETNCFQRVRFPMKTFQRVSLWSKIITQQVVGFQIKLFGSCQSLNFDFFKKHQFLQNEFDSFYTCTNGNFCILLAFLRCTIETESFLKISFWVETSNVSDSEMSVFQRVKLESTFSKIPRILDWVFYNMPDIELNFLWGRNNLGKNIGSKHSPFDSYCPGKRGQFCLFVCNFKMQDCDQISQFSIKV